MTVINFDTKAIKLLQFLEDHYADVPDKRLITGFTINADVDDVVRITWRTVASLKETHGSNHRLLAEQEKQEPVAYRYDHNELEKFAELIVRECAEVALREEHDPSDCILGHFGLER